MRQRRLQRPSLTTQRPTWLLSGIFAYGTLICFNVLGLAFEFLNICTIPVTCPKPCSLLFSVFLREKARIGKAMTCAFWRDLSDDGVPYWVSYRYKIVHSSTLYSTIYQQLELPQAPQARIWAAPARAGGGSYRSSQLLSLYKLRRPHPLL
jgi:hypothetical protein